MMQKHDGLKRQALQHVRATPRRGHVQGVQGLEPIERQRANAVLILAKNDFVHDFTFLVCPIEVQSLETL